MPCRGGRYGKFLGVRKLNKNFRIAESCYTCRFFKKRSGKHGYCLLGTDVTNFPQREYGGWDLFVMVWDGCTKEEFEKKAQKRRTWQGIPNYNDVKANVDWWKKYKDLIHMTHQANVCDEHVTSDERRGKGNPQAKKYINNPEIDWIRSLDKQK